MIIPIQGPPTILCCLRPPSQITYHRNGYKLTYLELKISLDIQYLDIEYLLTGGNHYKMDMCRVAFCVRSSNQDVIF